MYLLATAKRLPDKLWVGGGRTIPWASISPVGKAIDPKYMAFVNGRRLFPVIMGLRDRRVAEGGALCTKCTTLPLTSTIKNKTINTTIQKLIIAKKNTIFLQFLGILQNASTINKPLWLNRNVYNFSDFFFKLRNCNLKISIYVNYKIP